MSNNELCLIANQNNKSRRETLNSTLDLIKKKYCNKDFARSSL